MTRASQRRYVTFDGMRGIAALGVAAMHFAHGIGGLVDRRSVLCQNKHTRGVIFSRSLHVAVLDYLKEQYFSRRQDRDKQATFI